MIRVLFLVIGFILYGSLYPWEYRPGPAGQDAFSVLLNSWPKHIGAGDISDIAVNLIVYIPIGLFGFLALDRSRDMQLRWVVPTLLALILSTCVETAQVFDQTRVPSLLDVLDNTLGGVIGTVIGYLFRRSLSPSVFLVFYWIGFQVCAVISILTHKRTPGSFVSSRLEIITIVVAWGLVWYLLAKARTREFRLTSAIPLSIGFLLLLAVRGLAPYHFKAVPTAFQWVPFLAILHTDWIVGLPVFLEKAFYYGTAIWLLRLAGVRLIYSTLGVAFVLASIESVQRYLPGRTPEATDPVLALSLGFVLWVIAQDYKLQVQT